MNCKKCGAEIESGFLYCPKCGESIQLVPNYDVFEEELLSRVVEDKDKAKNRFATGVYKPVAVPKDNKKTETKAPSPSAIVRNKGLMKKIAVFLGIVIFGMLIIIPLAGSHSYDSLMNNAVRAESNEHYAKALGYYLEAYKLDNNSFEVVYGLGRMYYKVKEYDKAAEYLEMALEKDTDNKKIYTYLLEAYSELNDDESIHALQSKAPNDEILKLFSEYMVMAPEFSEKEGDYDEDIELSISATGDYQIFYTLNGKNPTTSGKLYTRAIKLSEGTTEVKAVCLNKSGEYSDVVSATYTVTYQELSRPVVSPSGGTFTTQETITITVPEGCKAYYSWDGSDPTTIGILYTNPIPVLKGSSVLTVVIKDSKGRVSPLFHGEYNYNPQ